MIETASDVATSTTSERRADDQTDSTSAADIGLGIPRELWSAPVSEARWCGVRPHLSPLLSLAPAIALVAAYLSAATAAHGHPQAAGWLLTLAVIAIVSGLAALAVHVQRTVRYRAEAPR
jgi:hypothetical protein